MMTNRRSRASALVGAQILIFFLIHSSFVSGAGDTETLIGLVGRDFVLLGADSSVSGRSIAFAAVNLDKIALLVDPFPERKDQTKKITGSADEEQWRQQQTLAAAVAGDTADADRLVGILQEHATLREYEAGVGCDVEFYNSNGGKCQRLSPSETPLCSAPGMSVHGIANLARRIVANSLRSRAPLSVRLLIAGMSPEYDEEENSSSTLSRQVQWQIQSAATHIGTSPASTHNSNSVKREMEFDDSSMCLRPCLYWIDEYGTMEQLTEYGVHGYASSFLWSILDEAYRPDMSREEGLELIRSCFEQLQQRYLINQVAAPPCIKCIDAQGCRLLS